MGSPEQIIAPQYIEDTIGDFYDILSNSDSNTPLINYLQIKPDKIFTLREYIDLIKKITKLEISVNWNTRTQIRPNIYNSNFLYENKKVRTSLEDGINSILTSLNDS
jgi:hypothetical protein